MNEHEQVTGLLALAAAGVLKPDERARVDAHAQECEECRRELAVWRAYADTFRSIRAPVPPRQLVERTRARILAEHGTSAGRRSEGLLLAVLAGFAWIVAITIWFLTRLFLFGAVAVMETNIVQLLTWSAGSTLLVWLTAAAAALILGNRRYA
jgi:anti-sigma factor RsiW